MFDRALWMRLCSQSVYENSNARILAYFKDWVFLTHFKPLESKSVDYKSNWLVSLQKRHWSWMGWKVGKALFCFLVKLLKYLIIPANITCSKSTIKTLEEGLKICPKLTIKTRNFEHILHLLLVFLLLTLRIYLFAGMEQMPQHRWKLSF